MRRYTTEAIIINKRSVSEKDAFISFFSREYGRRRVIAKGIRSLKSRRLGHLELFSHGRLHIHKGNSMDYVSEVQPISSFSYLRSRLERVAYAYIAAELVERLTPEHEPAENIFEQLHLFLTQIDDLSTNRSVAISSLTHFKQFLLNELGFIGNEVSQHVDALDLKIESVLESRLRSPQLLTNIYQVL